MSRASAAVAVCGLFIQPRKPFYDNRFGAFPTHFSQSISLIRFTMRVHQRVSARVLARLQHPASSIGSPCLRVIPVIRPSPTHPVPTPDNVRILQSIRPLHCQSPLSSPLNRPSERLRPNPHPSRSQRTTPVNASASIRTPNDRKQVSQRTFPPQPAPTAIATAHVLTVPHAKPHRHGRDPTTAALALRRSTASAAASPYCSGPPSGCAPRYGHRHASGPRPARVRRR